VCYEIEEVQDNDRPDKVQDNSLRFVQHALIPRLTVHIKQKWPDQFVRVVFDHEPDCFALDFHTQFIGLGYARYGSQDKIFIVSSCELARFLGGRWGFSEDQIRRSAQSLG